MGNLSLIQFTILNVADNIFLVELPQIREIINYKDLNKNKTIVDMIEGTIDLRGNTVPVIALDQKLGFELQLKTNKTKIIITEIADKCLGFKVDNVGKIVELSEAEIQKSPKLMNFIGAGDYIKGFVLKNKQMMMIIDLHKIITKTVKDISPYF